ncbi:MAG: PAS domain S-box protein, partial [Chloroflexota bacterium]
MNNKMTKAELQSELRAAEKQILELESSLKKVTEQSQLSTAGTPSSAENEALFSRVFQISPNPMALSDLETSAIVEVNDAFLRTFGYTKEEVIGRTARDLHLFVDPDQRDQLLTVMKAQGYLRDANLILRTKTGQIRHGVFSVDLVQVHDHNLLLTAMNDITDSKQNQDVLLKSEARFVTIFENSPVAISITRISDMKIIHVNSAFMKMYGFSREEILDHTAAELGIWADLNERQRFVDLLKTQKKVTDVEAVAKYRSGKEKKMLISGEVVEIDDEPCFLVQIIDITERKQAELELHQSRENYKTLFENTPHPMWVYDIDTLAFLMVNDAAIQHYGYSREEFLKMTILDIRPSEDHKALLENVSKVKDGKDEAGIWRHIKKDGSLIYVEITSHTLEFNKRKAELVHADDVTERVRATSALQASEANYRNLVEKSESAIAVVDRDGKILFANEKGKEIWHETEFIGKTIYDVFPQEYANSYLTAIRSVIDSQISIMDEIESSVAGNSMWFRISMTPLRNPDDSVSSLLLNAWDITNSKLAEQMLHESEEKYRTLVNSSMDGIFVAQDEKFVFFNTALPTMLGYAPEDFENASFAQVIAPEHLNIWTTRFNQRISGKESISNYQVRFLDKTGTKQIWIELRANRIFFNKKPAVLGIVRDITENKQLLEEMENLAKFPAENPGPVMRVDLNGKLLYANEASYALLSDWALEVGKPAPVILQKVAALVVESGQDKTIETTHKDHVVTLNFILLKHRDYINVYGLDITQQRLAEEKLRESEIRARAMLDAFPDLMFRMN